MQLKGKKSISLSKIFSDIESNNITVQVVYQKNGLSKKIICPATDLKRFILNSWFYPQDVNISSINSLKKNINDIFYDSCKSFLLIHVFGGYITFQPCNPNFECPFCGIRPFNTEIDESLNKDSLYELWSKNKINSCKHEIVILSDSFKRFGSSNVKEFSHIFIKNFIDILNIGYSKKIVHRQTFQITNDCINVDNISVKYYTSEKPIITLIELIEFSNNEIVLTNKELQILLLNKYYPKFIKDYEFFTEHLNITPRTLEEYIISYKTKINSIKLLTEIINNNGLDYDDLI